MPELPEVETTVRALNATVIHKTIVDVKVRVPKLRYVIPADLTTLLKQQRIMKIWRRAKYIIMECSHTQLLIHLGMSGNLCFFPPQKQPPVGKHDHVDWWFEDGSLLRYHDPRRFGAILYLKTPISEHRLLAHLGVEPLSDAFNATSLYGSLKNTKIAIKTAIMTQQRVVGVGNIYASEALFRAKIHPQRVAASLSLSDCQRLVMAIKEILQQAIELGGSSVRDFVSGDGQRGYFQNECAVYQRQGLPCIHCGTFIEKITLNQRSSFFCPYCQNADKPYV